MDTHFLNIFMVHQLTQCAGNEFHISITIAKNIFSYIKSLSLFKQFLSCPLLAPSSIWKNNSLFISSTLFRILKVWIEQFTPRTKDSVDITDALNFMFGATKCRTKRLDPPLTDPIKSSLRTVNQCFLVLCIFLVLVIVLAAFSF